MDELVQFLRVRYDEEQRIAEAAASEARADWDAGDENLSSQVSTAGYGDPVVVGPWDFLDWNVRQHIARHDPARVLRDIKAKRQLLALYVEHKRMDRETFEAEGEHARSLVSLRAAYFDAVRHHAAVYADHPDYRAEWRP